MPILSFSSQDIDIITGKKTMTIRKLWKTPLKKGDRLYCYWNLVSKEKKKIFQEEKKVMKKKSYLQLACFRFCFSVGN